MRIEPLEIRVECDHDQRSDEIKAIAAFLVNAGWSTDDWDMVLEKYGLDDLSPEDLAHLFKEMWAICYGRRKF